MKKEVEINFGKIIKSEDIEISILPGASPEKDFEDYINTMNDKFKFKNKDKFIEEILILISFLNPDAAIDLDDFGDKYYKIVAKHSSNPDLATHEEGAIKEIENIVMANNG